MQGGRFSPDARKIGQDMRIYSNTEGCLCITAIIRSVFFVCCSLTRRRQAVGNYKAADRQVRTFDGNILAEAKSLLAGKRKAYLLGEISLLELIEIQQTVNLMHTEYTEALYNKAVRWVELQRSVGCDAKF